MTVTIVSRSTDKLSGTGVSDNNKLVVTMMTTNQNFKAQELCSRKLWQLVSEFDQESIGKADLKAAIAELESRRHFLAELADLRQPETSDTE